MARVDAELARRVAAHFGEPVPGTESAPVVNRPSPALSQANTVFDSIATRKVAVLAADGVDVEGVTTLRNDLVERGAIVEIVAPHAGSLDGGAGGELAVDRTLDTVASVLYDAVVAPCGEKSVEALARSGRAVHFIAEAFVHAKPIAAFGSGLDLLRTAGITEELATDTTPSATVGVVTTTAAAGDLDAAFSSAFAEAIAQHRAWDRLTSAVPA